VDLRRQRWTPVQRVARLVVTRAVGAVARVSVEGMSQIPATGPVIIAANHICGWDAAVLLRITERRTVMLAVDELRRNRLGDWALQQIWGAIFARRGEGDRVALERALAVLRAGGMIGLGPEGLRSRGGLRRGLTGVAQLSHRSGAPVVPVAVFGQERISPVGFFRRAPVSVRIGEPIPALHGEATTQTLRAYTDRVMVEIARMLPRAYRGFYASAVARAEVDAGSRREIA
jgi:1-acyl-sn-glycerol-3-phosphate acyltransferase